MKVSRALMASFAAILITAAALVLIAVMVLRQ